MQLDIIGVSGKAGTGKDWVGREVLRPLGYQQWAFAWPMKNEAVGNGFTYEDVHDLKPPAVRAWLQRRGTEEGWHKHGVFYWCNIAEAWLRTIYETTGQTKFYFTDVRFLHEKDFVRALGGKLIRLEHGDRPYPLAGTDAAKHVSETVLDACLDWDAVIVNKMGTTVMDVRAQLAQAGIPERLDIASQLELFDNAAAYGRCCL